MKHSSVRKAKRLSYGDEFTWNNRRYIVVGRIDGFQRTVQREFILFRDKYREEIKVQSLSERKMAKRIDEGKIEINGNILLKEVI